MKKKHKTNIRILFKSLKAGLVDPATITNKEKELLFKYYSFMFK